MAERKGTRALELWCKRLVRDCPEVQIENMTTSWRNGMAFCALVHHFRPDLIDMSKLKPENVYENNQLAFSIAEKHLGIPALLDPEDMVANEVPDRLSVLTYLSQFYQRLGHTVSTKSSENDTSQSSPASSSSAAPIMFGKTGLDKCAACGLPVYLAQRRMVSHKLYHRRCFRCSKCSGHLNPKNFEIIHGSDFYCDSCKNEKTLSKILNDNADQMGMLAFSVNMSDMPDDPLKEPNSPKSRPRQSQSILKKISMFESNIEKNTSIDNQLADLSLKHTSITKPNEIIAHTSISSTTNTQSGPLSMSNMETEVHSTMPTKGEKNITSEELYKTNVNKLNFLQTQLSGENLDCNLDDEDVTTPENREDCCDGDNKDTGIDINKGAKIIPESVLKPGSNVTDDLRLAKSFSIPAKDASLKEEASKNDSSKNVEISTIIVPPRKKKNLITKHPDKKPDLALDADMTTKTENSKYPEELNPFSDDDEEVDVTSSKKDSTNPFGSSDEEEDKVPPIQRPPAVPAGRPPSPVKRLIHANPFWSDDEEPSIEEENSKMYESAMATSTPNLPGGASRHKKRRAPPPPAPPAPGSLAPPAPVDLATSLDDVASLSSLSSHNSTIQSDQKRLAPTPPDSISAASCGAGSMERDVDGAGRNATPDGGSRRKGPAPGLPLPERREVRLQMSAGELQVQLELLETQQLGLERQGVLIERMIRDKCEGDEASTVPQEEVEDLVIQLCELVNEKNDLFRKQTELMYIRRQQRLEQEQADIEHEIRVIQSQPAVNRCDADKAREEQLVSRLVAIVRMRDELVQQLDAERRRERQEDLAIAASIATKRAQRNSDSSASLKSGESSTLPTPKKSKVKDKVKKHLKKAKHTLHIHKKKDDGHKKEEKTEKENS